jgi:hypothetical protein
MRQWFEASASNISFLFLILADSDLSAFLLRQNGGGFNREGANKKSCSVSRAAFCV